jgi:hypothetical protein
VSPPCVGCGCDTAPRQVYCNRCRRALRLEGSSQGRRYGLRMMDSPEADLPRMSDELREAVQANLGGRPTHAEITGWLLEGRIDSETEAALRREAVQATKGTEA